MEPILRSAQVLKQEAEEIGFEAKDILEYVKEQQKLDREERAAWREAQKMQAQADVELAKIRAEAEAEERKRADQAEEKRRADEIKVQMAKIEAEKELTLREMELKAQDQASASLAVTPPPRNKDAKSPKLPSFIDEKDELDSYLLRFERYAENASWEKDTWAIKLSALLTGRAMDVYTRMSDADASDYDKLKKALLDQKKTTQSKPDSSQGRQRLLQCYRCSSVRRGRRKGFHLCRGRGNQIQEYFEGEWYRRIDQQ